MLAYVLFGTRSFNNAKTVCVHMGVYPPVCVLFSAPSQDTRPYIWVHRGINTNGDHPLAQYNQPVAQYENYLDLYQSRATTD